MMKLRRRKLLAALMCICMLTGMLQTNAYADSSTTTVIYVGGPDAGADGDGSDQKPFSTLKAAAETINGMGAGSYEIVMLGDTTETAEVTFGNGTDIDISISTDSVSGGAITISKGFTTGCMVFVNNNTTLTLEGTSSVEALIFDGGGEAMKGTAPLIKVWAYGTLNLNQNTVVRNNINNSPSQNYGGGIANYGTLNINGGEVSFNTSQILGGGVYNSNNAKFILDNGTISNNKANNGGSGIYNEGETIINGGIISQNNNSSCVLNSNKLTINGGEITDNDGYCTIYNTGTFDMKGGVISKNKYTTNRNSFYAVFNSAGTFNLSGSGIIEENDGRTAVYIIKGSFNMSGGTIRNNTVSYVISSSDEGGFNMSSGVISNNTGAAISSSSNISLSGDASIMGMDGAAATIDMSKESSCINISGELSNINSLNLFFLYYTNGRQVLLGSLTDVLISKFTFDNTNFIIDSSGKLAYTGEPAVIYVDAVNGSDADEQSGTSEEPLKTLFEAGNRVWESGGTIIVQSDLTVDSTIPIFSDVLIKSDNQVRTITQNLTDRDYMFYVYENSKLSLGEKGQTDGGIIIDNDSTYIDAVIYNDTDATVNLFDGIEILNTQDSCDAIYNNSGTINIDGGRITDCNKTAVYNKNDGIVNFISGSISFAPVANEPIGIYNDSSTGIINMTGGTITGTDVFNGVGVYNDGILNISGGTITGFTGEDGLGVYNRNELNLSGGTISNNFISVVNTRIFKLNGNPSIPIGAGDINYIYLENPINIEPDFELSEGRLIPIYYYYLPVGIQILFGDEEVIGNNYDRFVFSDNSFGLSETGCLKYIGEPKVYYVDAGYALGDSEGSKTKPFISLEDAVDEIQNGIGVGTIYISSDLTLMNSLYIYSDITILNDGAMPHTITPADKSCIFFIEDDGKLTLGSEEEGDDALPTLILYGGRNERSPSSRCLIDNYGSLILYPGVKMHGNYNTDNSYDAGAIINSGTLHMYGGLITDNRSYYAGGIINSGEFIIDGGTISNCYGQQAGAIYNQQHSVITINGGVIEGNTADNGVGIKNDGELNLSGNVSIPKGDSDGNSIWIGMGSFINLNSNITTADIILLDVENVYHGRKLIGGDAAIVSANYQRFEFMSSTEGYILVENGTLEYVGEVKEYYVNADSGSDGNVGNLAAPFASLNKAVTAIETNGGVGTIHICSDLVSSETVCINGSIKLINEGNPHVILREAGFKGSIFEVNGRLELGDDTLDGQEGSRLLTIDGNGSIVESIDSLVYIYGGSFILHNGVVLENNFIRGGGGGGGIDNSYGSVFIMGGVIQNNIAAKGAGLNSTGGSNTIYDGEIRNNEAYICGGGINIENGALVMSGGKVSNNKANNSAGGIYAKESTFTLSGGEICGNEASWAGGIQTSNNRFVMTGGSICSNKAEYGAGLAAYNSELKMSGGEICCNLALDEYVVGKGIIIEYSTLTILGNVSIFDDVALYDYDDYKPVITVGVSLSDQLPVTTVDKWRWEDTTDARYYPVGAYIIKPSKGYTLTAQDISRFRMSDSNYDINSLGRLATGLKESWFTLTNAEPLYYTGTGHRPAVKGQNGSITLLEGTDYQVTYTNNINVGTASVTIVGMGNYGGSVTKTFSIQKAKVLSIITPAPADKTISASEGKSLSRLIQLINLNEVTVNYGTGTVNLPITWTLTEREYNVNGGSCIFTGTLTGNDNVDPDGKTLTAKIAITAVSEVAPTSSVTPTPTAVPTVVPGSITELKADTAMSITQNQTDNTIQATIQMTASSLQALKGATGSSELTTVAIPIASNELTRLMQGDSVTAVNIDVTLPNSLVQNRAGIESQLMLDSGLIQAARDNNRDLSVSVKDEDGLVRYSWSFSGEDLTASDNEVGELDLSLGVQNAKDNEELSELIGNNSTQDNNLVLNFGHHGELPAQASVRIYVGDMGYSEGDKLYLYYYNSEIGKLDTLPYSSDYVVDRDGYITVSIVHCSEYVLLPKQASTSAITSLRNQIGISADAVNLYLGSEGNNSTSLSLVLPNTLELVKSLKDKTSQSAIGAVTVTYKSGNSKVVSVDDTGKLVAKKTGKAVITVTATLYSGKTKTFMVPVTVKNPSIKLTKSTDTLKLGDSFTFKAEVLGLDNSNLEWKTTKKSIVTINKKTGKATAKSKGTDYVVATIGDVSLKVKVTVN